MPTSPPRVCARCRQPAPPGQPCRCRQPWEGATPRTAGRPWRDTREAKLNANPICERPNCPRLAVEVDHIVPKAERGTDDWTNLASLCADHHREKTTADALRGKRRLR